MQRYNLHRCRCMGCTLFSSTLWRHPSSVSTPKNRLIDAWNGTLRRELILGRVSSLVKKFVYNISIIRGLSEAAANAAGGEIFTFGSYRLGVHGPGSDIDTLCVVPKHVSREDFFDVFENMLRDTEGVTEVSVSILQWTSCLSVRPPDSRM